MIHAVFFDIGGTVHTQDATPESDRDYIRRLWCFLHMNHIYTAETPEQLLEHINAGAKAYKSYTEQELIELPPDMIWQKFFLKDFDIPAEKLAGLGEELCYMFDRYRKHIVKREGLKETLEALRQRGYRLGVISNIMSTTFVPRILEEHGITQYFETITMSSVCGIRKPRPEIFEIALNEMRIGKEQAAYVGDTISRDVRGVRNAGWPLMIQIDNPRIYHKDEKYRGMGYEPDVKIGSLQIPESVVISWVIMLLLVVGSILLTRNLKVDHISKRQAALEALYSLGKNFFEGLLGKEGSRYVPYLMTVALYIACSNVIGVFGVKPPTKDLDVTAALALMSIVLIEYAGVRARGGAGFLKSLAAPTPIMTPMNILEIAIRPTSLCMRLFGNVLGAFVIMELLKLVVPVFVPAVFSLYFDLFDGLIQTYVFVFLTALFMKESIGGEE